MKDRTREWIDFADKDWEVIWPHGEMSESERSGSSISLPRFIVFSKILSLDKKNTCSHFWLLVKERFLFGKRSRKFFSNPKNLKDYQNLDFSKIPAKFSEKLTPAKLKQEKIMLGLRLLQEGIDKNLIQKT